MSIPQHEQDFLDGLEDYNPLGWKPWKRDALGQAMCRTILPAGPGRLKECVVTITAKGLEYRPSRILVDTEQEKK